jgi:prolyl oligopeptidase
LALAFTQTIKGLRGKIPMRIASLIAFVACALSASAMAEEKKPSTNPGSAEVAKMAYQAADTIAAADKIAAGAPNPDNQGGDDAGTVSPLATRLDGTSVTYPKTKTVPVVEEQFGVKVADPYRWLEGDVRTDKDVANWVAAEKQVTDSYLATLPGRDALKKRMTALYNYERYSLPQKAGGHYFFTKNDGLQNQSVLYVRKGLKGKDRMLIDPNGWAKDGATALDAWALSQKGKYLAYAVQDGGSDWRSIKLIDVTSGKPMADAISWAKFTGISWIGDEGFLYSRFAVPEKGKEFQSTNENQQIYFHRVGSTQSADQLVYATPDRPKLGHSAEVTHDNRWVVITSAEGTDDKYEMSVIPLAGQQIGSHPTDVMFTIVNGLLDATGNKSAPRLPIKRSWHPVKLVAGLDHDWRLIEGMGDTLYFMTNKDAPKLKVVRADLDRFITPGHKNGHTPSLGCGPIDGEPCGTENDPPWTFADIIPERTDTLDRAQIVGNRLILSYIKDATTRAEMVSLDGKPIKKIELNAIGTASGFSGVPGDPETFYGFSSFNQPGAIYRFDSATGKSTPFAKPKLSFDPAKIEIKQVFYPSKDGTKIPMFIVHKKDLDMSKGAPTLLYAYGGFNLGQMPGYNPRKMAWIMSGGVYALANIRGGNEYGKAWHDAGRLQNKQNVFDDFIAAGEYLVAQGITTKGKLAVEGRSNGGLLIGAVVNQRPDLFAAAHAAVGVMDMLRFDRFTAGRYWVDDYGYPSKEADFRNIYKYSPYHNIKSGVAYPAIIVSTADTDDRVVPMHSFKYISRLQAAETGDKPKIIRIETRAGHGSGKPTDKEYSDIYGFLAKWTGLDLKGE